MVMNQGFTLIELLLVVVIIGIVAAFVLPKFGDVKEKAYVSAMKNDLRNLATDQEIYFENNGSYRDALDGSGSADAVPTSEGVTLSYRTGWPSNGEYVVLATHNKTQDRCVINRTGDTRDVTVAQLTTIDNVEPGAIACKDF